MSLSRSVGAAVSLVTRDIFSFGIPRYLSLVDKNLRSPTYGCSDRCYWKYRIKDYCNFRFQEGGRLIGLATQLHDSPYRANSILVDLCRANLNYAVKNTNRNGSVTEVYPYENSYCATAMLAFALSELMIGLKITEPTSLLECMLRWLGAQKPSAVINQSAAAAAASYNTFTITGNNEFLDAYSRIFSFIQEDYAKKGFFSEYGGFDLGYSTLTCSLLAHVYLKNSDKQLHQLIQSELRRINDSLGDNGEFDENTMSRKTQFIYPFALVVFEHPAVEKLVNAISNQNFLHPLWMDDRYFVPLSIDYLSSSLWLQEHSL
ncbi:MAG: hypothetical protein HY537_07885 [Deltaproteobacteria bacterium]|nr:hypothetical protein [Deltaproteobacteria bacterium]